MLKSLIINQINLKIKHQVFFSQSPTLIFLHDSLGCTTLWRDFPEILAKSTNSNLLIYDRQGYGQSDPFSDKTRDNDYLEQEADTLNELITKCALDEVILFGHSDGGSIALIMAAKYPNRIKAVITEGAHVFVESITLQGIRQTIDMYEQTDLRQRLAKYHGDKTEAVFWAWAKTWLTDTFSSWNIEHFLPQIKCPILVIQGENDEYGSLAQVQSIVKKVSTQVEARIIPSAAHTPHKEAPTITLQHVIDFMQKHV